MSPSGARLVEDWDDEEVLSNLYALSDSTVLLGELLELLRYRFEQIDFIDEPVELGFDCPSGSALHLYPRPALGGAGLYEAVHRS